MDKDKRIKELEDALQDANQTVESLTIEVKALQTLVDILKKNTEPGINEEKYKRLVEALKKKYEAATEQLYLFNEIEATTELGALDETPLDTGIEVSSYIRKKSRSGITIPAETPVIDIYDDSKIEKCSRCGADMVKAGEKVYETFTRINRTVVVRKHITQFSCPKCLPESDGERIIETPVTGNILDGTVCDPTLLAQIIENKFAFALPLYRQAEMFSDVGLSRYTMSSWLMKVSDRMEANMAPCLEKLVYSYPLVNTDETPVKVLGLKDENGNPKGQHSKANAFMIVRAAVDERGRSGPVIFSFSDNRRNQTMIDLLSPYGGVVQTDGLYSYANAEKECFFTHIDCLIHSRRKATEACGNQKSGLAYELLKLYRDFFHFEALEKEKFDSGQLSSEEYIKERREVLEPLLDKIKKFCTDNIDKAVPSSALHTAFKYPLDRWGKLIKFLDFPFAVSHNNRAENAIRPFCLGKKNWLFTITELGAEASAFYYSLVESCKAMGINTLDYLTWLFLNANKVKDGDEAGWTALLPGQSDISAGKAYREKLFVVQPDPNRTEPYKLRGKRV